MKCLEKLSLIDDECLDDVKKDIEAIINSYINVEEMCIEIYDKIEDKLTVQDIKLITKAFDYDSSETVYFKPPQLVSHLEEFKEMIREIREYNQDDEECVCNDIYNLMSKYNNITPIDFSTTKYWFYRDGANRKAWLLSEDDFKKELREAFQYEDQKHQIEILKRLKKIKKFMVAFDIIKEE